MAEAVYPKKEDGGAGYQAARDGHKIPQSVYPHRHSHACADTRRAGLRQSIARQCIIITLINGLTATHWHRRAIRPG